MPVSKSRLLSAIAVAAAVASPALAQSSAAERNLVYMGKSSTMVVMVSDLPATPATGQHTIWVWHFGGADHARSNATGPFGRAVRMTVDCADRTTINRASEQFNGTTFVNRTPLTEVATWSAQTEGTLGVLPVKAVCDPAPATPRPTYPDLAAARAYADLRLKPAP